MTPRHPRHIRVVHGRQLAEQIPGAHFVELDGEDQLFFIDVDELLAEVESFLTGVRPRPRPDRVLAAALFTDIVASTAKASESR